MLMETLKKYLALVFDRWWLVLWFYLAVAVFAISLQGIHTPWVLHFRSFLTDFSVVLLLVSMIWQLSRRRFLVAISHFVFFVFTVVALIVGHLVTLIDGDHYADDLKLPANMLLAEPVPDMYSFAPTDSVKMFTGKVPDLILYDGQQPGYYSYEYYTTNHLDGRIYLKAFEISYDDDLSPDNMLKNTMTGITGSSGDTTKVSSGKEFKIYEGDWGKYYAARFEVWFIADDSTEERKIFEKNFKIQGWMH